MQVAGGWRLRLCRIQEWCSSGGETEGRGSSRCCFVDMQTLNRQARQHSYAPIRTNIMGSGLRL
jgi:hypothetical protein